MHKYYEDTLSAERLRKCYDIAPPRIKQYLQAELEHVLKLINPGDIVLDLGCGYGRIMPALCKKARLVIGIDTSLKSLDMAKRMLTGFTNCQLFEMNAVKLSFPDKFFNKVVCIQNGISAFHVDQQALIKESVRVTKKGGIVMFSTYSEKFREPRLQWFQLQAQAGLIGEIDCDKTRHSMIVCKDGFTATTVSREQFHKLTADLDAKIKIVEVDKSSLFCEIIP